MLELKVKKLVPSAILPTKASPLEAGWDLYALESISLVGQLLTTRVRTGIAIEIPSGYCGLVCDRSSLGKRGFKVMGGVIDSTYRGELLVMLANINNDIWHIQAGDKMAQMLIVPVPEIAVREVVELTETVRGDKGFGQLSGR